MSVPAVNREFANALDDAPSKPDAGICAYVQLSNDCQLRLVADAPADVIGGNRELLRIVKAALRNHVPGGGRRGP
jgi:hypothetical protein